MLAPIWEPVTGFVPAVVCFVCDLFFRTSAGYPMDRFWPLLGHPWSGILHFLEEFKSKFAPNVKQFHKQAQVL